MPSMPGYAHRGPRKHENVRGVKGHGADRPGHRDDEGMRPDDRKQDAGERENEKLEGAAEASAKLPVRQPKKRGHRNLERYGGEQG